MADQERKQDGASVVERRERPVLPRQPYSPPKLVSLGRVAELTFGNAGSKPDGRSSTKKG